MTGQIDLIEEEIVLSHERVKTENKKTQQRNLADYPQSLTHNADNDMGDYI
jgi:hypothetical protein